MKINNFKKLNHSLFWVNGMLGMTWGFISSLVVGVILNLFIINQNNSFVFLITNIKNSLTYICGFAIGIGVGIKNKLKPLAILATGIGAIIIAQSLLKPSFVDGNFYFSKYASINMNTKLFLPGDVFGAFFGSMLIVYFFKIFNWETRMDIIIVPFIGILLGLFGMLWITYLTSLILLFFEWIIYNSINKNHQLAILLSPIIAIVMGLALSLPTSSAAIAFAIQLKGDAATAAIAGTAAQMISFGVLTYFSTRKISISLAVAFGTSMIQMKNFTRKPIIFLIPCLVGAIVAIIGVSALPLEFPLQKINGNQIGSVTSGMGSCALYGQIFTLNENGWTNYKAYLNVIFIQLLLPLLLTLFFAYFFIGNNKIIKKEWLKI